MTTFISIVLIFISDNAKRRREGRELRFGTEERTIRDAKLRFYLILFTTKPHTSRITLYISNLLKDELPSLSISL